MQHDPLNEPVLTKDGHKGGTSSRLFHAGVLARAVVPVIEGLERRTLLSATLPTPILLVDTVSDTLRPPISATLSVEESGEPATEEGDTGDGDGNDGAGEPDDGPGGGDDSGGDGGSGSDGGNDQDSDSGDDQTDGDDSSDGDDSGSNEGSDNGSGSDNGGSDPGSGDDETDGDDGSGDDDSNGDENDSDDDSAGGGDGSDDDDDSGSDSDDDSDSDNDGDGGDSDDGDDSDDDDDSGSDDDRTATTDDDDSDGDDDSDSDGDDSSNDGDSGSDGGDSDGGDNSGSGDDDDSDSDGDDDNSSGDGDGGGGDENEPAPSPIPTPTPTTTPTPTPPAEPSPTPTPPTTPTPTVPPVPDDSGNDDDDDDDDDASEPPPSSTGRGDTSAPDAELTIDDIAHPGGSSHMATVVFSDNKKVKISSITTDAFSVTGPGGESLAVTDVQVNGRKDAKRISVDVTFAAPGGSWDASDDGRYRVRVEGGKVKDGKGNVMGSVSDSFRVRTGTPDTAAPVASISVDNVTSASTAAVVTVTYEDDLGLNLSTIGAADLEIHGPGGSVEVDFVDVDASDDETRATVRYTLDGPLDFGRNGDFTIRVKDGAVKDGAGNGVAAAVGAFTLALSAPPVVDPTFTPAPVAPDFVSQAVAVQSDGAIILAGALGGHGSLQRFLASGAADASFGSDGAVLSDALDAYFAVAVQADDKILAAGTTGGDFLLVRYNPDGSLDGSFAAGGRAVIDLGGVDDAAYSLALTPDGSVVLAGGSAGNFAFAKVNASGALDATFGLGGRQLFDLGGVDVAGGVAVQQDGKVIAVGATGAQIAAVRLTVAGDADDTFSTDGVLMLANAVSRDIAGLDRSQGVAVQPDGRIILASHTQEGDFSVLRLDTDGGYDPSFGADGLVTVDMGGDDDADAVLLQPDGQILVLGTSLNGGQGNTAIAALDPTGELITYFGNGGKLILAPEAPSAERELHVGDLVVRAFGTRQPDGSVVVGTSSSTPRSQPTPALRRLNVPGTRVTPRGSKVAEFGIVGGRKTAYTFTDDDGTAATFTLKNGTASVWLEGETLSLVIADSGPGAALTVKTVGGDGRLTLGGVTVNGSLKSFNARTVDLAGTLYTTAVIGKVLVGDVTGTIAAGGGISSVAVDSLTKARVFSGAMLGTDGKLGGSGADADTFASGYIGKLRVAGAITDSLVSAGLNPIDGTFANGDDVIAGGAESMIRSISAASADAKSKFFTGTFGKVLIGEKVDVVADDRFELT